MTCYHCNSHILVSEHVLGIDTNMVDLRHQAHATQAQAAAGRSADAGAVERNLKGVLPFYIFAFHALLWFVVCLLLMVINLLTLPIVPWFIFPTFGWGIGLAIHGIVTYVIITAMGGNMLELITVHAEHYLPADIHEKIF